MKGNQCPCCGTAVRLANIKTTVWAGERLYAVEDVPAQVCDGCGKQFYDEETTNALHRFTEEAFPSARAMRELLVPVFSLQSEVSV